MNTSFGTVGFAALLLLSAGAIAEPPAPLQDVPSSNPVTLIEAGIEPRTTLRYTPKLGVGGNGQLSLNLSTSQNIAGRKSGVIMPTVTFDLVLETQSIDPKAIRYQLTFENISVADDEAAEPGTKRTLQRAWSKLKGSRALVTVDACGVPQSAQLKLKKQPPEELAEPLQTLAQAIRDMPTRFPVEPVGLGATWSVTEPVISGGQTYTRTTTWTLVAASDNHVTLSIKRTETAPANAPMGGLPEGMTATITRVAGQGGGKTVLNRTWLLPIIQEYRQTYEMDVTAINAGKSFDMKTTATHAIDVIRLEPEKKPTKSRR